MKKRHSPQRPGKTNYFDRFARKKSNAAIKEEFRQEKRKWKKEREEFFEKKKSQSGVRSQESGTIDKLSTTGNRKPETGNMPLNKFIAHCGVCSRRDAAEMVKLGKVKLNGELVTEPGRKVSVK